MSSRILVTGGTGFIGRHAVEELHKRGYEVHATARKVPKSARKNIFYHSCDLLSDEQTQKLVSKIRPTHLMHLAWYVEPKKFWEAEENTLWLQASLRLFRQFAESGGQRAVFTGSCAEYDWSHDIFSEKSTPLEPRTRYGKCKDELRAALQKISRKMESMNIAWGRIFFLYGPHEARGRLVPEIINGLLDGKPVSCTEGREKRDFMYVADVARAFVEVMESDYRDTVNIASGRPTTIGEVVRTIGDLIGRPELLQFGKYPTPADDPVSLLADTQALNEKIGFEPHYSLREGLEETVEWWKDNPFAD